MKTKVIGYHTHCSLDCEELGGHTDEHTVCDRCGAHVHKRVFEIERTHDDGTVEYLSVGSECFKDVMGYSWKQAHDKALSVHKRLVGLIAKWNAKRTFVTDSRIVKDIKEAHIYPGRFPELSVPKYETNHGQTWGSCKVRTEYGFTATLARAGEDLSLWSQKDGYYSLNLTTKKR